ncbi:MAG TPA: Dyp-type peroxidase domain-containing protein, partial [Candidatus Limnocylindrales bacterium]|nr:Dyp-type peroxidase domain-containing protein [Candidatus Limnocylindrales bacterium]
MTDRRSEETAQRGRGVSRRELLGYAAAGTAGLVVGGIGGPLVLPQPLLGGDPAGSPTSNVYPFYGAHQAGVTTAMQDHLHFAAFDMAPTAGRAELISLLQDWSYVSARMTQGLEVSATGATGGNPEAPPDDTGEALDLTASGLTVTIGFGPTLF